MPKFLLNTIKCVNLKDISCFVYLNCLNISCTDSACSKNDNLLNNFVINISR